MTGPRDDGGERWKRRRPSRPYTPHASSGYQDTVGPIASLRCWYVVQTEVTTAIIQAWSQLDQVVAEEHHPLGG